MSSGFVASARPALVPASDSAIGLDPARLGSLDERSEAANLSLVSFESGRVNLPLEREVLLMESDLLRPWLVAVVELAHDGLDCRSDS